MNANAIVARELAKNCINNVADEHNAEVEFYSVPFAGPDVFQMVCRATYSDFQELVAAMWKMNLKTSLQQAESQQGEQYDWAVIVQVPETWTMADAAGVIPAAQS